MRVALIYLFIINLFIGTLYSQNNFWNEISDLKGVNVENIISGQVSNDTYIKARENSLKLFNQEDILLDFAENTENFNISDVLEISNGKIFISSKSTGVYIVENGKPVARNSGLSNTKVTALFANSNNEIYAATWFEGGLFKSTNEGNSWELLGLENNDINDFIQYKGKSFVAIDGKGIQESTDDINWSNSWTGSGFVYRFYLSFENNLMAITSTGILIYDNNSWKSYHSSVNNRNIIDFKDFDNGAIVFLQSDGKLFRSFDNLNSTNELPIINQSARIFNIDISGSGKLVAGTNVGAYYSNFQISHNHVIARIEFDPDSIFDANEELYATFYLENEFGQPLKDFEFEIEDSRTSEKIKLVTNNLGFATYQTVIPEDQINGDYHLNLTQTFNSQYIFHEDYKFQYSVFVDNRLEITLEIFNESKEVLNIGGNLKYLIKAIDSDLNIVEGLDIIVFNSLISKFETIATDDSGEAIYNFIIPEDSPEGIYYCSFDIENEEYKPFQQIERNYQVDYSTSVKDKLKFNFVSNNNLITVESDEDIISYSMYDIKGNLLLSNDKIYSNFLNIECYDFTSGVYLIAIQIGNKYIFRKFTLL